MKLSSNLNLFSTFLLRFLKYNFILFLCVFSINAYSQNIDANESKKQPSFNQTNIQVSELTKPSLGSLGIKTEINNLMGLNLIGLRRSKVSNDNIKKIQLAYKNIFKTNSFRDNIENLEPDLKKNEFIKIIINFINSDKKRPISLPPNL